MFFKGGKREAEQGCGNRSWTQGPCSPMPAPQPCPHCDYSLSGSSIVELLLRNKAWKEGSSFCLGLQVCKPEVAIPGSAQSTALAR